MLACEFHPLAARELDQAVAHYETVAPGKGLELAAQIEAAIAQIRQFPESAPVSRGNVRSVVVQPSSRWAFTLHYSIKPKCIRVLAIAHQRRQPFYWLGRERQ